MRRHEQPQTGENLTYYSFDLFEPFPQVPCVISARLGGVSEGYLRSLNLSFRVGDEEQSVITNRSRFYAAVGVEAEAVAQAQLVHGTHIAMVTSQSPCGVQHKFAETDGLVTNVPNRALFIPVADCAAVAFFDPKQRVIAMVHAGWKGVIGGIVQKMISTMKEAYGSNPSDILVSVSPSIGPCCYKVREDLVVVFTTAFPTYAHSFFLWQAGGTIHLDMWAAIRWQLHESGIQDEHIEISSICTACHTDLFYSHRAEKGKTGRFAGLIVLRA
jgi:polyphenol oxidase